MLVNFFPIISFGEIFIKGLRNGYPLRLGPSTYVHLRSDLERDTRSSVCRFSSLPQSLQIKPGSVSHLCRRPVVLKSFRTISHHSTHHSKVNVLRCKVESEALCSTTRSSNCQYVAVGNTISARSVIKKTLPYFI